MEFFLHPWYMAAGGALVSAPILIHLINRMRFKRVRWAAMEFLLKSQKRNRRRLIIEQLILLALRCLLVLLAGFLVARYIGGTSKGQGATHIVIIDDTPSMADHWKDDEKGGPKTCLEVAREQLKQLARSAAQAASHQQMRVLLLSDLDTVIFDQRLNDRSVDELDRVLAQNTKASAVHIDPAVGLKRAQALFNDVPQGQKILHFVSDFRDGDWAAGAGTEEVTQAVEKLTSNGIHVSLIDTAHPYRMPTRPVAGEHDNLAIIDLRPEAHVIAEGVETEFSITIANYSPSDKRGFMLHVKVDGVEAYSATKPIERVEANGKLTEKFTLVFAKKKKTPDVKPDDSIEERERKIRLDREYFRITAQIDAEATGLAQDNVRDLVVEVRKRVPSLVVGANKSEMNAQGSDLYHLTRALEAARSYEVHLCPADQLDKVNLELYPNVIFLNVAEIKSQKTLERLQQYVKDGGSIAYFLGDKARPSFYNDVLYKQYAGLFPALIGNRPVDPINPDGTLSPEDRQEKAVDRLRNDPQPRINFPDPEHKMARGLKKYTPALRFLSFDRYWKTTPRHQWETEAISGGKAEVVAVLPNNEPMDVYKNLWRPLTADIEKATKDLADADSALARYVEPVNRYRTEVRDALATEYPYNVVRALDNLRNDPGSGSDDRPPMPTLWENPAMKELASRIDELRNRVLYGDPLVVARPHGRGRVVAILTAAGTASKWNDWAGGSPVSWSYPVFIMDLERYLVSEGGDNRVVGDEVNLELDAARYMPDVKVKFQPQPEIEASGEPGKNEATPAEQDQGRQIMQQKDNRLTLHFTESRRPGVYTFEFAPRVKEGDPAALTETRSYAFNIDAARESDLRRAPREKLERPTAKDSRSGTIALRAPGDSFDVYRNRQPDASESPWLYLVFLLILIAEQAMAVHLSFHLKGSETAPAASGAGSTRTESTAA